MLREIRDWFCMGVLAYWLKYATAQEAIAVGSNLVRMGIEAQTGQPWPTPQVELVYGDAVGDEGRPQTGWVA